MPVHRLTLRSMELLLCVFLLSSCTSNTEKITNKEILTLPSFDVQLADSITVFNTMHVSKGQPTVLIYFNPDCEYCHAEIKDIISNIHELNKANIYLITTADFNSMKKFKNEWRLDCYNNIVVARDYEYNFFRIFKPDAVPYTAIYNNRKKLVAIFRGSTGVKEIIEFL